MPAPAGAREALTGSADTYEVFAIKYATRDAQRSSHFIGGDPHDGPMPMDYFVWLVRNANRTVVVDTGFTAEMAKKRKRTFLRTPTEGLALLGVDAATVKDVVITHMHYDHVGTFFDFPAAHFHLQDLEMNFATGRYMRHGRFNHGYEVEDVVGMVRLVFGDRVRFHAGSAELAPGIDPEGAAMIAVAALHTLAIRARTGAGEAAMTKVGDAAIALICGPA